jgi:hypothetical protein
VVDQELEGVGIGDAGVVIEDVARISPLELAGFHTTTKPPPFSAATSGSERKPQIGGWFEDFERDGCRKTPLDSVASWEWVPNIVNCGPSTPVGPTTRPGDLAAIGGIGDGAAAIGQGGNRRIGRLHSRAFDHGGPDQTARGTEDAHEQVDIAEIERIANECDRDVPVGRM